MLKNKSVLKVFTVLVVMLVSIVMLTGCEFGKKEEENAKNEQAEVQSFEEPIKKFIEGLQNANAEKFLSAFPPSISDMLKDSFTDEELKLMIEEAEQAYGKNIKMTYDIKNKKEIPQETLATEQENMKNYFNTDVTISKGYELELEITTKGDDSEEKETDSFNVYEIDGKWYLLDL